MTALPEGHSLIVGASGAGKTVTAKGEVERLLADERHVCIVDPTGVWHGLRAAADGEGEGFAIPIFGGQHGDVPIAPEQGEAVGSILAGGVSAILDLSAMDSREQQGFVADLIGALRRKPRGNFHLIVDEADEFAPQTSPSTEGEAAKRQMEWIAKRGRVQGFVLMAITQRPADIAKSVISQMQTVVAHQLLAPSDQGAVKAYLRDNADKATLLTVMESLAGLGRGERWIYSPRAKVLERGVSPMPATFDSSRTPEPGEQAVEPKMLAEIDLGAIREALAPPKVEPEASGTAALNMSANMQKLCDWSTEDLIDELERRDPEWLKDHDEFKAAIKDRDEFMAKAEYLDDRVRAAIRALGVKPIEEVAGQIEDRRWAEGLKVVKGAGSEVEDKPSPHSRSKGSLRPANSQERRPATLQSDSVVREGAPHDTPAPALPGAATKMLDMLDRMNPARVSWASLAGICGYKPRGGNFNAARKAMRESGRLIEEGDSLRSGAPARDGMTREEARSLWKEVLSNPAPEMIDSLDVRSMTRQALGDFMGKAARGGHFNNGVAQLLRNGVAVEVAGRLQLADPLPGERP